MRRSILIAGSLLIISGLAWADINAVLDNGVGARSASMGFVGAAAARGAEAIYWNPAILAGSQMVQLSTYASDVYGTAYKTFGFTVPTEKGDWGLLLTSADQGSIPETTLDVNGRPELTGGSFSYNALALYLSFAREVGKISLGTNLKYLSEGLADKKTSGLALDIGILARPLPAVTLGAKAENILATQMRWDTTSQDTQSVNPDLKTGIAVAVLPEKLSLSGDCLLRDLKHIELYFGGEYSLLNIFLLRAGVFSSRYTFGLGLAYKNMTVDYGFIEGNDFLEDSQRVSINYSF